MTHTRDNFGVLWPTRTQNELRAAYVGRARLGGVDGRIALLRDSDEHGEFMFRLYFMPNKPAPAAPREIADAADHH